MNDLMMIELPLSKFTRMVQVPPGPNINIAKASVNLESLTTFPVIRIDSQQRKRAYTVVYSMNVLSHQQGRDGLQTCRSRHDSCDRCLFMLHGQSQVDVSPANLLVDRQSRRPSFRRKEPTSNK